MCYSPNEAQADEYEAVRDMLCPKCLKEFEDDGFAKLFEEYDFCDECKNKIDKYYEERYND